MIIKKVRDHTLKETEVVVRYAKEDEEVKKLLAVLRSMDRHLICMEERLVMASDVYYIESVDKKTFLYLKEEVLRSQLRLYQLKEILAACGYVQISKSCLLNLNALVSIRPLMNSRMEAMLTNGERVYINRGYLHELREALEAEGI